MTLQSSDGIQILTFSAQAFTNLPQRLPAWLAMLDQINANRSVRCLIIQPAAGSATLATAVSSAGAAAAAQADGAALTALLQFARQLSELTMPVLAVLPAQYSEAWLTLALAADYRLAGRATGIAFNQVQTGLIPANGLIARTVALLGMQAALELLLGGRRIDSGAAVQIGLVDRISQSDDLHAEATVYAAELLAGAAEKKRVWKTDQQAGHQIIDQFKSAHLKKSRGLLAPMKIIELAEAALDQTDSVYAQLESKALAACLASPQHAGLCHAALAEREAFNAPETRAAKPRALQQLGVIGGGTMGAGIALALLQGGFEVIMIERDHAALQRGRQQVEKLLQGMLDKQRIDPVQHQRYLAAFSGSLEYAALAHADLVIEAVFEDMAVKQAVFAELDAVCKAGAILASNTSYLDLNQLAASISRPADVIGLHFFSPAHVMKLLEIVVPDSVAADVVATGFALAGRLKKVPVRAGVCDGFIGNRILAVYRQSVDYMMEDGASPYQIDKVIQDFGLPMGPFQMSDLAGGDIGWATRKRRAASRDPRARYVQIADRICERGWFGQKTGRGFYLYAAGERGGKPDMEVLALIEAERQRAGVQPRKFHDDEILRRYMAALINEAANVLEQGIALRPLDVDVVFLNGYGFPRYRGGPLHYADSIGLDKVLADIEQFAREDALFWKPSVLLRKLVEQGKNFASLNRQPANSISS